jgi:hypothetical protein
MGLLSKIQNLYDYLKLRRLSKKLVDRFIKEKFSKEIEVSKLKVIVEKKEQEFRQKIKGRTYRGQEYSFGAFNFNEAFLIYSLIRLLKPNIIVETGVCNGVSSAFILLGLKNNFNGQLYSVDFPEVADKKYGKNSFWEGKDGAVIPAEALPGWIIPQDLKKRWHLILGKTQDELLPLLKRLKKVDLFIHDSEHSYECMSFEYNSAYRFLTKNGVMVSHDITWNSAFSDFAKQFNRGYINLTESIGLIIK